MPLLSWLDFIAIGCRVIESSPAIPESVSIAVAITISRTDPPPGTTYSFNATGSLTVTRADYEQVAGDLASGFFALGRPECGCPGPIQAQGHTGGGSPDVPAVDFGESVDVYFLGEGVVDTEDVYDGVPVTGTPGTVHLYIVRRVGPSILESSQIALVAAISAGWSATAMTDWLTMTPGTWAELVTGSPYEIDEVIAYTDGGTYAGTGDYDFTVA